MVLLLYIPTTVFLKITGRICRSCGIKDVDQSQLNSIDIVHIVNRRVFLSLSLSLSFFLQIEERIEEIRK
jgi:hypothetical protein